MEPGRLARVALPILAVLSFVTGVAFVIASAGDTLGYDFLAYHQAAQRVLDGRPLYDMTFEASGGFGLFYYPPLFLPFILVLGALPAAAATSLWLVILLVAFVAGVAVMPVGRAIRWWIILLAGLSFPFVYAVKLGQVGPLLFLTFAVGWRWIDEPLRLGVSGAVGAAIKLQPGLVLVWALLTRRRAAVMAGAVTLLVLAAIATALAGFGSWADFATLLRTVSEPITTPHNFTPGAVAYQLGVPASVATVVQLVSTAGAMVAFLLAIRLATSEASYLAALVVSQLVSPILWDHYTMLLLLPVAFLLSAGRWWALAIPLVTAWPLVGITPPFIYPLAFWATLVALIVVGRTTRRTEVVA